MLIFNGKMIYFKYKFSIYFSRLKVLKFNINYIISVWRSADQPYPDAREATIIQNNGEIQIFLIVDISMLVHLIKCKSN